MSSKIDSIISNLGLANAEKTLSVSAQRLSSGLRINGASDDPAGLAIANSLQSSSRLFSQAVRNINDGVSLLNVSENALSSLQSIMQRQVELATAAENGTISSAQRSALQTESNALVDEFNRIVRTTTFNGRSLLDTSDPTSGSINIQAGVNSGAQINLSTGALFANSISYSSIEGSGTFSAVGTNATGVDPRAVAVGDVNGDGIEDYVTADYPNNDVSVFIGNGDGTFKASYTQSTGSDTRDVQLADVNHDGKLDIVTANVYGKSISVLLGNGDGSFKFKTNYAAGYQDASFVQLADVNGDGNLDALVSDQNSDVLVVLLGNADGTFGAKTSFNTGVGTTPQRFAVGDFNGDGKLDVATAGKDSGTISILLGNGNGTFKAQTTLLAGPNPADVAVADFNGDGKLDLLSSNAGSGTVTLFLGNGNGTFASPTTIVTGGGAGGLTIADINGDGTMDFAVANRSAGTVNVFIGNGNGTFKNEVTYTVGTTPLGLKFADFNNDGALDLVVVNEGSNSTSILLQGTAAGPTMSYYDLTTQTAARNSLTAIQSEGTLVASAQGSVAAGQSRLEIALNNAQAMSDGFSEAASRIMDVDVAAETAKYIKAKVLAEATTALAAQANQEAELSLTLLKFGEN